jgi:RHS repeat-associated protein
VDSPLSACELISDRRHGAPRPHENWRGQFARGTWGAGSLNQGMASDCPYGGASNCFPLAWPGARTNAWHQSTKAGDPEIWMGSLVNGMRDATGQIYMRNRYYDPHTGQFTQSDPIGLAGGLNAYGFANGDPVTYSDPYGLAACPTAPDGDPRQSGNLNDCTARETQSMSGAVTPEPLHDAAIAITSAMGLGAGIRFVLGEDAEGQLKKLFPEQWFQDGTARSSTARSINSDLTRAEFEASLIESGWHGSASKDGRIMNYTLGGAKYSLRSDEHSNSGPTADYYGPGSREIELKLRFAP